MVGRIVSIHPICSQKRDRLGLFFNLRRRGVAGNSSRTMSAFLPRRFPCGEERHCLVRPMMIGRVMSWRGAILRRSPGAALNRTHVTAFARSAKFASPIPRCRRTQVSG